MLFNSQLFLVVFLPLTLVGYYALARSLRWRIAFLIAASFVFYSYWDVRFGPLLLASVFFNWLISQWYRRAPVYWLITAAVGVNLGLLALFKYTHFILDALTQATGHAFMPHAFILPLGISFFTFQQISYLIDLRRGSTHPHRLGEYFFYVLFFPHLIAGPIVRHNELIPQMTLPPLREGLYERLSRGWVLLALGLSKKVLIADRLADGSDILYKAAAEGARLSFAESWNAALGFSLQLYYDFSGYSDMAIGLALMLGFTLPVNFLTPYAATSLSEFWRRWHITLSQFLREYVYIPLGGSRNGLAVHVYALLVTMLLCGLWHGAGWTFVAWGALHGIGLVMHLLWRRLNRPLPAWLGWVLTMVFVVAGWVLFRAHDFASALSILHSMTGLEGFDWTIRDRVERQWLLIPAALLAIFGPTNERLANRHLTPRAWWAALAGILMLFIILDLGKLEDPEFIYFQF